MFHGLREFASCHLQEVDRIHIPTNYVGTMSIKQLLLSLDESQGSSQLHDYGPWLVCEVTYKLCRPYVVIPLDRAPIFE